MSNQITRQILDRLDEAKKEKPKREIVRNKKTGKYGYWVTSKGEKIFVVTTKEGRKLHGPLGLTGTEVALAAAVPVALAILPKGVGRKLGREMMRLSKTKRSIVLNKMRELNKITKRLEKEKDKVKLGYLKQKQRRVKLSLQNKIDLYGLTKPTFKGL